MTDDIVNGTCDARFAKIREHLEHFIKSGQEVGASIAVNVAGRNVVDLWGGYKDEARTAPWTRHTIVNVFSCTKNVVSLAVLMLVDRGLLDVDEKVSRYWPEFAANGKQDVLVRHLLSHTAGLPGWEEPVTIDDTYDPELSAARLAAQPPCWPPGTALGYHLLTMGHLLGELVRRVTGKSLREFVATEVAGPLGADFQIGVSEKDWPRVTDVIPPPRPGFFLVDRLDPNSLIGRVLSNPPFNPNYANTPGWRGAELGAANGHGNARSLARIHSVISLGGAGDATTSLLSKDSIDLIFREQIHSTDLVIGVPLRFGIGFGLAPSPLLSWMPEGRVCYWLGVGGSFVVMDLDRQVTIAYAMNKMNDGSGQDPRVPTYGKAVYEALGTCGS